MRRAARLLAASVAAAAFVACGRSPAPDGGAAASSPSVPAPRPAAVLERGPLGSWDDFRVAAPVVMRAPSADGLPDGTQYRMWYLGCRLALRTHACAIGHATSADGHAWRKAAQPVLPIADPIDRSNVDTLAVVRAGDRYFLWYGVPVDWFNGRRRPALHLATSADGLAWHEEGLVFEGDPDGTFAMEPSVFHDGKGFHLWYVTRAAGVSSPLLRHFDSADGRAWNDAGATEIWKLRKYMDPFGRLLVRRDAAGRLRALFTHARGSQLTAAVGEIVSEDGTAWQIVSENAAGALLALTRDEGVALADLTGLPERDGVSVWMTAEGKDGVAAIRTAFLKGLAP
jgi:hypothetical protein